MSSARSLVVVAAASGALFGVGLALGGMTQPSKVIGFLDVGGRWDPSLALVMLGAVGVHALILQVARRSAWGRGLTLPAPASSGVDARLVTGAAVFGVGWGLGGYCPGPGVASLGAAAPSAIVFVVTFLLGFLLGEAAERAAPKAREPTTAWR